MANPFLPLDTYIADGEPHVFGDRIYLFGSHDKEGGDTYCMLDYEFWSAPVDDLDNWSCEGVSYCAKQDPQYGEKLKYMYAPDVVQGNDGRFYLYYCMSGEKGAGGYGQQISVAVCDTPDGKYEYCGFVRNPDGSPMRKFVTFDPAVINDGGVIRLYYGTWYPFHEYSRLLDGVFHKVESKLFGKSVEEIKSYKDGIMGAIHVELADDMLTIKSEPCHIIPNRVKGTSFEEHPFFEGSSIRKIGSTYYFIYSSIKGHELCYATSQYPDRDFVYTGFHPDAPAWLRLKFAERECELSEYAEDYHGWISMGWIQQEQLHIDVLPAVLELPRRYAFRYLQIEVLDVSSKYQLKLEDAFCIATTSADETKLQSLMGTPRQAHLDAVACRTLRNCMQEVFEDGPKRDRRLWIGDLRMQALANYETFKNYDLVRRCLYLFAGSTLDKGRVGACIFIEPEIEVDDTVMFDYSLFFIPTLLDYYKATGDLETLKELAPTGWKQIELIQAYFDETNLVRDSDVLGWCFVDWNLFLNKQASAQGIYLYCLKAAMEVAMILKEENRYTALEQDYAEEKKAAELLWDAEKGFYISGEKRQISWASQVWMTLGGAENAAADLLKRLETCEEAEKMVTPYMYHNYVDALISTGEKEKALVVLSAYWGGMLDEGADTFWELYNPENRDESPYGGTIVNSYCHAWSCAPAYFLRKYYRQ